MISLQPYRHGFEFEDMRDVGFVTFLMTYSLYNLLFSTQEFKFPDLETAPA